MIGRCGALALALGVSVACGAAPASPMTTPSAAASKSHASPAGFSVAGLTAIDAAFEPRVFRMNASTLALVTSTSRSWTAYALDPHARRLSAIRGATSHAAQEYVTGVRGVPEDAFISIEESLGRASVRAATMRVTGGESSRAHEALRGVSEWANGQRIVLRGGEGPFMDLPPQHFELVNGTVAGPAIPPRVRYAEMAAFPSGKLFALGRPAAQSAPDAPWFMYVHDGSREARAVPLPERLGDASFVEGMGEPFLTVLLRDSSTGASHVARWNGASFTTIELPLDADIVQGSPQGTLWQASTREHWVQSTSVANATKRWPLPESAPCRVEIVTSLVALQDDDVWLGVQCQCDALQSKCGGGAVLTNANTIGASPITLPSP